MRRDTGSGLAAGLLAYAVWGLIPVYWKMLSDASPLEVLCHRIVWCLVVVTAALFLTGRTALIRDSVRAAAGSRRLAALLTAAAVLASANWLTNILGAATGRVVELGIGMFLTPIFTVAAGVIFFRERLTLPTAVSLALALLGAALMARGLGRIPWIALAVSTTWAGYSAVKKYVPLSAWSSIWAEHTLMLLPALAFLAWLSASDGGAFMRQGSRLDALLVGTGLITAVPMVAFSYSAKRLSLTALGFIQYLNPILTTMTGVLLLGESLEPGAVPPLLLILAAVAVYLAERTLLAAKPGKAHGEKEKGHDA